VQVLAVSLSINVGRAQTQRDVGQKNDGVRGQRNLFSNGDGEADYGVHYMFPTRKATVYTSTQAASVGGVRAESGFLRVRRMCCVQPECEVRLMEAAYA